MADVISALFDGLALLAIGVVFWTLIHFLKLRQAEDRRYDGADSSSNSWHGNG